MEEYLHLMFLRLENNINQVKIAINCNLCIKELPLNCWLRYLFGYLALVPMFPPIIRRLQLGVSTTLKDLKGNNMMI